MTRHLIQVLMGLLLLISAQTHSASLQHVVVTQNSMDFDAPPHYYRISETAQLPTSKKQLLSWLEQQPKVERPQLFGGRYVSVYKVTNQSSQQQWVYAPYNSVVSVINTQVFTQSGSTLYQSGERGQYEFAFHYGKTLTLPLDESVIIVTEFHSAAFYTPPKIKLSTPSDYQQQAIWENLIMMLCFSVGIVLGLYNLLIYLGSKDKTHLYYAFFTAAWVFAWSHFFHIPSQLFAIDLTALHWFGFILTPLANTLFYIHLLKLNETHPRFARGALIFSWVSLIGLPISVISPGAGFIWATFATAIALCLGLYIGIRRIMQGYKPARYFVLAYMCMALPNMVGNLTNLGLLPSVNINLYHLGLIGTALDALLLAFAVADKFRLINDANVELTKNLEAKVQERTGELQALTVELRDASEAKTRFLANMSHEIRTPMTSIIGYAEGLLLGDVKANEQSQATHVIAQNARHVLGLLNDILDMSKIEANRLEVESAKTHLFSAIGQVESILGKQIRDKGLGFSLHYHFPLPDYIYTDATRLRQILLNLTANALKFTSVGSINIDVAAKDERLIITVKDTGIGMSEQEQFQLFEAFYQADSSTSRKYGGTGLGLNISKSLARKLGGDIDVQSIQGQGTAFTVDLALKTTEQTQWLESYSKALNADEHSEDCIAQSELHGHVLLAEDNRDNAKLLQRILERMGLQVTWVENGQLAVTQALERDFDLVLMDIQMPIMDGEQALSFLQATGCTTPVIALTANTMSHEIERYLKLGFADHLGKPIDREQFAKKIAHYLALPEQFVDIDLPESDMQALRDDYVSGLAEQRVQLENQSRYGDLIGLGKSVHALKGSAAMFGFEQLQALAEQADKILKSEHPEQAMGLIDGLIAELAKLEHDALKRDPNLC